MPYSSRNKKNILLVRTTNNDVIIPPLGLLYIAAVIRERCKFFQWNIKILDFTCERSNKDNFIQTILEFSPDVIGFSSLNCESSLFKELSTLAKKTAPDSVLIAGGPLVSNYYNAIIKDGWIDFAVIGEGEMTTVELLDNIYNDKDLSLIKGIAYRKDEKIVLTPPRELIQDLDTLPLPAWDLIDLKRYGEFPNWNGILRHKYHAPILTSRGCVYNCIYCHNFFGKKIRTRSVENVILEIETLYKIYGIKEFHIIDDFFNSDLNRVKKICRGITDRRMKIKLAFPGGLRADRMDRETLIWLKKAGAYKINYAIETSSPRLQKVIKKNLDIEKTERIINETSKLGIITFGFFMFGFPTETEQEMRETASFAINSRLDTAKFFKVTPYRNTELAKLMHDKSFLHLQNDLNQLKNLSYYNESINCSDVPLDIANNIFFDVHWQFYKKPSRIFHILFKYKSFKVLIKLLSIYNFVIQKRQDTKLSVETFD